MTAVLISTSTSGLVLARQHLRGVLQGEFGKIEDPRPQLLRQAVVGDRRRRRQAGSRAGDCRAGPAASAAKPAPGLGGGAFSRAVIAGESFVFDAAARCGSCRADRGIGRMGRCRVLFTFVPSGMWSSAAVRPGRRASAGRPRRGRPEVPITGTATGSTAAPGWRSTATGRPAAAEPAAPAAGPRPLPCRRPPASRCRSSAHRSASR